MLAADLAAEGQQGELHLTDEVRAEYNRIKEEAGAKTCKMAQDLATLQATQKVRLRQDGAGCYGCNAQSQRRA